MTLLLPRPLALAGLMLTALSFVRPAAADDDATLMRFPTLHGQQLVFEAHGNLWQVDRTGGVARRLTTEAGYEVMPRFSPDGKWIAFTGQYQGNRDVYVMPAGGGTARRLTFHSDVVPDAPLRWGPNNMVLGWTPDSKNVVFLSRAEAWNSWYGKLFSVPLTGGLPTALPLDRGGLMSYSPDGKQIAYNRIFRNFRTWKRYDGGLAQDVYTYDFASKQLTRITDWKGTDTAPMWYGHTIYFLSDRDANRRENIWAYDLDTKQYREVTHFSDYDVDFPSIGIGAGADGIAFQQGGHLYVLDLPSEKLHELSVAVPDDGLQTSPRYVDAADTIRYTDVAQQPDFDLSSNGKRLLLSARGDLFSVPAEHGNTRNLTETSNADEDHPAWSPDGSELAYTTDVDGEQQIAVRPSGGGAEKILTHFKRGYAYQPLWSPDGKHLAFSDNEHRLWVMDVDAGAPKQIAQDQIQEMHDYSWSPDGRWLAYSLTGANQVRSIWLYNLTSGKATRVSDARDNDFAPVFDPKGRWLYFVSTRHELPTFSESEFNIATLKSTGIYVATLKADAPSPFAPRSDEARYPSDDDKKDKGKDDGGDEHWKPGASKPIDVDLDGLMQRAVPMPIAPNDITELEVRGDLVYYMTSPSQTIDGPLPGEDSALHIYDMHKRKDATLTEGLDGFHVAADDSKLLYVKHDEFYIVDAKPNPDKDQGKSDDKPVDLSHMRTRVDPRAEWREMFASAWRLERDFFFNPKMNGVDWNAVRASYEKLLPLVGSREDLNYVIGEVQGELGNSHTYVGGGDDNDTRPHVGTAMLGADLELDAASGRYRIAKIYHGDNTRERYRAPLTAPGIKVKEGDYLLAIDDHELKAPTDPYSLLVNKADGTVKLTLASSVNGKRHDVVVKPVNNELALREQAWIDHNRETVDRLSGGKIGYIYLSDMEALGMEQFIRQFYSQLDKQALIVDDRWNGGGFIDQIVLERLRRILVGMSTNRERATMSIPEQLINGPKVCLINHYSASDGDIFPYYFRKYGLGKLIGTRTWGGVRGIRGSWTLLDGGYITVPEASLYGLDSNWVIENHGVDPDIEVEDAPGPMLAGHDPQLETAVNVLLDELKQHPVSVPQPPPLLPAYPPAGER
ncbi:S41 family peptidase [Solimonas marina]|uniref:Tricorn protease homolog n=1 Tax=Solimonas marina TaxID=2714601 RepID=A0A970B7G6_9GAMM|nr:S41 family peptidase [Solimonas marina]NKF21174.1 protease [Solimonas marina]